MEIRIPYGAEMKSIRLPPEVWVDFLSPASAPPLANLEPPFAAAVEQPVGCPPFSQQASPDTRAVILVSDLTRGRGTETLLPLCIEALKSRGVPPRSIKVVTARGTHRKLTPEERAMFRSDALRGVTFLEHDCDDAASLCALMLTKRGTPVRINAVLRDADLVILLAPVSFHYFAGYGGGRKLVLPGCADRASILANHRLSLVDSKPVRLHPECRAGNLDGNPVHEDMCEVLRAMHGVFSINFYTDENGDIVFLNAGDPFLSHREACEAYRKLHRLELEEPYDVMILGAGGYPYDINLLQSHKALRHAAGGLKLGGVILYVAECAEGAGSQSLEAALRRRREDFLEDAYDHYDLNNQTAVSLFGLTQRFEIGMATAMSVDVLLAAGVKPCLNVESFVADALEKRGASRVAVVAQGTSLLLEAKEAGP